MNMFVHSSGQLVDAIPAQRPLLQSLQAHWLSYTNSKVVEKHFPDYTSFQMDRHFKEIYKDCA